MTISTRESVKNRAYRSKKRDGAAEATQKQILTAASSLFARHGIDAVTIANIGKSARVAGSTVYALFKSKEGILRALMRATLFGSRFQDANSLLVGVTDARRAIELTAQVARAIYESETKELGLLRGTSGFSPALRQLEQEFEALRFEMQKRRIELLFDQDMAKKGLTRRNARRILWMYTSRDIYRMLVHDGRWTPQQYQNWLSETLVRELVDTPTFLDSTSRASSRKRR